MDLDSWRFEFIFLSGSFAQELRKLLTFDSFISVQDFSFWTHFHLDIHIHFSFWGPNVNIQWSPLLPYHCSRKDHYHLLKY